MSGDGLIKKNRSPKATKHINRKHTSKMLIQENIKLYALLLPVIIYLLVFKYKPMYGLLIAFQDFIPGAPILSFDGSTKWVGFKHFIAMFKDPYFFRLLRNTLHINLLRIFFAFPMPIIFAILINEIRVKRAAKTFQTLSYMPHFVSSVVVAGMVISFVNGTGIVKSFTI